jgi:UDP-glucose 4-epimerase
MVRVIPLFVQRLSRDMPITIYGKDKVLDFTYVDDCVEGIVQGIEALASGRAKNETINLAYGKGNTLVRMAELVAEALGKKPDITLAPALVGEVTHYIANISKATSLLGYVPRVSLEEGIPQAVKWQMDWMSSPRASDLPELPDEQMSAIDQDGGSGLAFKEVYAKT